MNQELFNSIIIVLLGTSIACIGWCLKSHLKQGDKIIRIETLLALMGEKYANVLHSPHTPELDSLLEKYCDRNYELSPKEWNRLIEMTSQIENDVNQSKESRALAAMVNAFAMHKMMLPPPKVKRHDETVLV